MVGVTVICCVISPVFHKYEPPVALGVANNVVEVPSQIVELFTETVGAWFTTT